MSNKVWTIEDIQFLENNYNNMLDSELAVALGRTESAVQTKRLKLGFVKPKFRKKYSFEDVLREFAKTEYELLSTEDEYIHCGMNNMRYICPKHREKGEMTISLAHLMDGRGCYYCGREIVESAHYVDLTDPRFEDACKNRKLNYVETKRTSEGIYVGFTCDKHPDVGIQYMDYYNLARPSKPGCPYCHGSEWENKIRLILVDIGIPYETEKTFDDLRHISNLRFDFYLPTINKIIEYDGKHHFSPFYFNGISKENAEKSFNNTILRDKLKNDYCKKRHIPLLRIPYYEFDNAKNLILDFIA